MQELALVRDLKTPAVKARFGELLGKNAAAFMSTLLTVYNGDEKLQRCSSRSILGAAGLAATLNLAITPELGYAYIIPYGNKAQFQIGYKGYIQLAMRSGQYKTITSRKIFEGEIKNFDMFTELPVQGEKISDKVVGYLAYFKLVNGFEKCLYMTVEEVEQHAAEYSQSYNYDKQSGKKNSYWSKNFDKMAVKTVLKLLLKRWGVLSSELQTAIDADQAVVDKNTYQYIDNSNDIVTRDQLDDIEVPFVEEEIENES